jgi:hypothetical protein
VFLVSVPSSNLICEMEVRICTNCSFYHPQNILISSIFPLRSLNILCTWKGRN